MPDLVLRGLDEQTIKRIEARARRHGRSLQSEAKLLIEQAAGASNRDIAAMLDGWKQRFAGRRFASSLDLIREDRDR
ncbi:MAG: hypothetical protein J7M08_09200 [Planctomycetes bacterium]|nr:hypothetical protein [Planctomycetota bacterium]